MTAKVRSRPGDPLASLRAALAALGLGWEDVAILVHGTTLVTNAIVEDRLPAVALVATQGFADVLAIGRQNRRSLYSLSLPPKLPPMVPEGLRFELKERMGPDGKVLPAEAKGGKGRPQAGKRIARARADLGRHGRTARRIKRNNVREGAADVNADAPTTSSHPPLGVRQCSVRLTAAFPFPEQHFEPGH